MIAFLKEIRVGDLLVYHPRPKEDAIQAPDPDRLVTHRVIRQFQVGDQRVFLTKGDHRWVFDPVVLPDQIIGRIARRKSWDRWIAQVSYLQAIAHHRWMCLRHGRVNSPRHKGIRRLRRFLAAF